MKVAPLCIGVISDTHSLVRPCALTFLRGCDNIIHAGDICSQGAKIVETSGVLYLNPGSAGPRRFKLPISIADITIDQSSVTARLHEL